MAIRTSLVLVLLPVLALYREYARARSLPEPQGIVKTIEDKEYGVLIDCIDIYKQPALSHPLLKNHTIQMKPSRSYSSQQNKGKPNQETFRESWSKFGECPEETIPILRRTEPRKYDQVAAKVAHIVNVNNVNESLNQVDFTSTPGVEVAQISVTNGNYVAAHAYLNVWTPAVVFNETSSAQIWLISNKDSGTIEVMSAGWMVDPTSHYSKQTTFFVFWTANARPHGGCFNLECPGFVQVTKKRALGGPIRPVSTYEGKQYVIELAIIKDNETGNWWLMTQDVDWGYWPPSIFSGLRETADYITWGGQVMSIFSPPGSKHTSTQMGSGHFPDEGFKKSSYIRTLSYATPDSHRNPVQVGSFFKYTTRPRCYDVEVGVDKKWGPYFYFGGPGYSKKCINS